MTTQYEPYYRPRRPKRVLAAFLLALLIGIGGTLWLIRAATHGIYDHIASTLTGRTLSFNTNTPVVVDKIRQLNRLETITYSLDTVVEGSSANTSLSSVMPGILYGDRILMVVHGQSIAGVDLSQLGPQSVVITSLPGGGRAVKVTLPPAQVFVTALDNAHTRVYSRTTGWLNSPDKDLESATRDKAEQQLAKTALDDGILDAAAKNARATITLLLSSLGFQQVTVN
jgi:hypothetical protein